jgi:Tol biopolymer transport system component
MRIKHFVMLAATIAAAACNQEMKQQPKYIGPSDPEVRDGIFSPEVLLSLGRLSDPQLSPDGKTILYGVSYNSLEENRSCRNIYACAADGSGKVQLTREGRSVSNARWSPDGKAVFFLQGGQLYKASFNGNKLGKKRKRSDVPKGIDECELSPDGSRVMYVSSVHSHVEVPSDSDPALDKARA